jgi:hypothetical protein
MTAMAELERPARLQSRADRAPAGPTPHTGRIHPLLLPLLLLLLVAAPPALGTADTAAPGPLDAAASVRRRGGGADGSHRRDRTRCGRVHLPGRGERMVWQPESGGRWGAGAHTARLRGPAHHAVVLFGRGGAAAAVPQRDAGEHQH